MKRIFSAFAFGAFVFFLSGCGNQETNHGLPIPPPPASSSDNQQLNTDTANKVHTLTDTTSHDSTTHQP